MAARRPYSGEDHRKSVEEYSLQMLSEEVEKAAAYWGYGRRANGVLSEIKRIEEQPRTEKDVSQLLPLLAQLRSKASTQLRKLGGPREM